MHIKLVTYSFMKKAIYIFLLVYYSFGTICLPSGDFSILPDLHQMYQHCKATEDKDLTPFDFITDHLMNIDGVFDKHDNGDEQKPHTPIQLHHSQMQSTFVLRQFVFHVNNPIAYNLKLPFFSEKVYFADYISKIFRPPIFA